MRSREQRKTWSDLRSTRWAPPRAAGVSAERRGTYVAALQQAEELFSAADAVGVASAPVLLFYGLSQAGRAIAAAAAELEGDDWQLSGHGIKAQQLSGKLVDIRTFAVPNEAQSSFVRLSHLLRSPIWNGTNALRFSDLWATIPDLASHPISHDYRPPLLATPNSSIDGHQFVSAWISGIPNRLAAIGTTATDFIEFMSGYPTATGYTYVRDQAGRPQYHLDEDGMTVGVQMHWSAGDRFPVPEEARAAAINRAIQPYTPGLFYLFPEVLSGRPPLHPLMAWWAMLYALSMLARYHPDAWARAIDVDGSEYATALEHVLVEASTTVPALVLGVLGAVS